MTWTVRRFLGLCSIALTASLILFLMLFVVVDSSYGQAFLARQTAGLVGRILGPEYRAVIARQTVDLSSSQLVLRWNGVEVRREGVDQPQARIETVAAGLDPAALAGGRIEIRSLEVSGVRIDVTAAPESAEVAAAARGLAPTEGDGVPVTPPVAPEAARSLIPALAHRLFGQAEHQLQALTRLGVDDVAFSNMTFIVPIAPGGGPFVMRLDRLDLDLGDPQAMTMTGLLSVDRTYLPVDARLDFDPKAERLRSGNVALGPVQLGSLFPPASEDDPMDQRPFGSTSDLRIDLGIEPTADPARRDVRIALRLGKGHLQQGRGHADIESILAEILYSEGEDRIALANLHLVGGGADLKFRGIVEPLYDGPSDGAFNGFGVNVESVAMHSAVGRKTPGSADGTLRIALRTDLAAQTISLTRFALESGGGSLAGTAAYRFGSPDAKTELDLVGGNLPATAVKAFWPFNLAVGARRWVQNNVGDDGAVLNGSIGLHASRQRFKEATQPDHSFRAGELELAFSLAGLRISPFGEMPDLLDATGNIETHGGDTLVTLSRAAVEDSPAAAIDGGLVSFTRVEGKDGEKPYSEVKIVANASGKAATLLAIASRKPLEIENRLPFAPKDVLGTGKVVADIDLLLGDEIENAEMLKGWKVAVDLANAGLAAPVAGRKVSAIEGSLTVDPAMVQGKGQGRIDGALADFSFKRSLAEEAPNGTRMDIVLKSSGGEVAKLAPALQDIVTGPFEAKLVERADQRYSAAVDLSGTALTLPAVGWRKGKGIAAELAFEVAPRASETEIANIRLDGEGFLAEGRASFDKAGLKSAQFGPLSLNPGDDVRAKVDRVDNGFSIDVTGERFDLRPLLADIKNDLGAKTASPPKKGGEQIDLSASVARVVGFGDESIADFSVNYAGSGGRIAALSIAGKARGNAPFNIDVSPRGAARAVEFGAQNAGALADFAGAYTHMDGGKLTLSLVGSYDAGYHGKLTAKNFALVDEPRLSRLVGTQPAPNSQSLSQAVGRDLSTERATFDHASADIDFGKGGLRLANGIIRGPIFGSSFDGTVYDIQNRIDVTGSFMPAYGLNRVFGAIPVVGQILGNGREGGLIGITYRLSGAFSAPKLEINPISAIAPGIFRNIFAFQ